MTETAPVAAQQVYAIYTAAADNYDILELYGLYATAEKAEAEATALRARTEVDEDGDVVPLYAEVTLGTVTVQH